MPVSVLLHDHKGSHLTTRSFFLNFSTNINTSRDRWLISKNNILPLHFKHSKVSFHRVLPWRQPFEADGIEAGFAEPRIERACRL